MNPGNSSNQCIPCEVDAFCPLGSSGSVGFSNFSSYTQTFNYPDSPDIDNYDDLLLLKFANFNTQKGARCLLVTPLFWSVLISAVTLLVWFAMFLLKNGPFRRRSTALSSHRKRVKVLLKHMDLITEDERWIGGLASFIILGTIGFTCWFAADYLHIYPIETSNDAYASCDAKNERNAQFDNALQLPLSDPSGSQWDIPMIRLISVDLP